MVEKNKETGGDCTWHGCVPSKALIRCARAASEARKSARFGVVGVNANDVRTDWEAVKRHIRSCQEYIYKQDDAPDVLRAKGVEVLCGRRASFINASTLSLEASGLSDCERPAADPADSANTDSRTSVTAKKFIICTGAGPVKPPLPGLDDVPYETYETIFGMEALPESLIVIGGGPIGAELAQAFARLGSKVTIVAKLLPREDEDVREVMRKAFAEDGIKVIESRASAVEKTEGGVALDCADGTRILANKLLVSAGRRPAGLEALELGKAGVKYDGRDGIEINSRFQTNVKHIFASGDCTGGLQFTHLGAYMGAYAAAHALFGIIAPFLKGNPKNSEVPRCTFTHPEIATVGLTFDEAKSQYGDVTASVQHLSHNDRAICEGEMDGFIKIVTRKNGKIVGATVVANVAGEIASEIDLMIKSGKKFQSLAGMMHAYPTFSWGLFIMGGEYYYTKLTGLLTSIPRCCPCRHRGTPGGAPVAKAD